MGRSIVTVNRWVGCDNYADSTSNYINITGVQLEVGKGASDFEFLPYDVQLQRCQRYYTKFIGTFYGGRYGTGSSVAGGTLPTTMRATPTTSYSAIRTTTGLTAYPQTTQVQYIMGHISGYVTNLTADAEL